MRSIPAVGALGLTAVSFLTFFLIGQHHPFGSEASSSHSNTLSGTTAVSQSLSTPECHASGGTTSCPALVQQPSEAELRASLAAFADSLTFGVSQIVDALRAVASIAADAGPRPVAVAPAPVLPVEKTGDSVLEDAISETVATAVGRASDAVEAALPGTVEVPPLTPAPSVEVAPSDGTPAGTLRAAVQSQAQSTIDQAFAASQVHVEPPVAPSLAPSAIAGDAPSSTTPTPAPSSTRAQADPGCVVEESQGDNWSRSAVRCSRQEVRTTGASTSSVTTASSSVSVTTTTGGAGVP